LIHFQVEKQTSEDDTGSHLFDANVRYFLLNILIKFFW